MKYISTRGGVEPLSFLDAVMMGLAADGGLLLPERIPVVTGAQLAAWEKLSYPELAARIFSLYIEDEIPAAELERMIAASCAAFDQPQVVAPLVQTGAIHILELFHGPTLAFKDVALQFLGHLFAWILSRRREKLNILGATSGDTGSAAIYGLRGKENINIFIIHPHGRVSPVQERQMTSVLDDNVFNIAVEGSFDDGQRIVKEIFADLDFKLRHHLGAVNSINWARVMAQIVYYFAAWLQLPATAREKVEIVVPSGNFGNIFAGYLAKKMGLPLKRLVLASNSNNILYHFITSGVYQRDTVVPTWSPSMDIQVASNFERYFYYLMGEDAGEVRRQFSRLDQTGRITVTGAEQQRVQEDFAAGYADNDSTLATIAAFQAETGYLLDPHTAAGVKVARERQAASREKLTSICLATAHPAKFPAAVARATGISPPVPPALQGLEQRPTRMTVLPATTPAVKEFIAAKLAAREPG